MTRSIVFDHLAIVTSCLATNIILRGPENGRVRLEQVGEQSVAMGFKFRANVIVDCVEVWDAPRTNGMEAREIGFTMVKGDFEEFRGSWRMERTPANGCVIIYSVTVSPMRWLPVKFIENRIVNDVKTNLDASNRDNNPPRLPVPVEAEGKLDIREAFRDRRDRQRLRIREKLNDRPADAEPSSGADGDSGADFAEWPGISNAVDPDLLVPGEFVVHKRVGIGSFMGAQMITPEGKDKPRKYLLLKYADGVAKLPAAQAKRLLYRYRLPGEKGQNPTLSRLKDPRLWEARKEKGRASINKMVCTIMELYVERLQQRRPPYPPPGPEYERFAQGFAYTLTPDQASAIADIIKDMTERQAPMERLVCGDVGFGKTEVALRAIFLAAVTGRQVVLLAPTTVLATQHHQVLLERLKGFPEITVALLSRLQKPAERAGILQGAADGSLRVLVGTHAVLSDVLSFRHLALMVIDEEQRFGVKQKEKLKAATPSVDVLTLSATPIPRTLQMALCGFRDASVIATPPTERLVINTHIAEYSREVVQSALAAELERGGQAFYVVPHVEVGGWVGVGRVGVGEEGDSGGGSGGQGIVEGIQRKCEELQAMFPKARVVVAHGQLRSLQLASAIRQFVAGGADILLCTSIVENGVDIPAVNTILIEDVHLFGMAQLYQLRGRVGRANKESVAYFLYPPGGMGMTVDSKERLRLLVDCCQRGLGQGMQVAEADMGLRGAGNLFGEKQSGLDMARLGFDLYMEMLYQELERVEQQALPTVMLRDVTLDMPGMPLVDDFPPEYIPRKEDRELLMSEALLAAEQGLEQVSLFMGFLRHRYGTPPVAVNLLLRVLCIRKLAAELGIHKVSMESAPRRLVLNSVMSQPCYFMLVEACSAATRQGLSYEPGRIRVRFIWDKDAERVLNQVQHVLSEMYLGLPKFVKHM
eukprot:jgi/Mesvir1/22879/Mv19404-RA.1